MATGRQAGTSSGRVPFARPLLLALACCAVVAPSAAALPAIQITGRAVPIPGFPHTGNYYGAGAAVEARARISGTEYSGHPNPLIGLNVFLPRGVKLDAAPFPTCAAVTVVTEREPRKCPAGSRAGPPGRGEGVVQLGGERVPEEVEILSFYAPHGGFLFLALGHAPVVLEVGAEAFLVSSGAGGFGPEWEGHIPLVETVPGAPDASLEGVQITLGGAMRRHGRTIYYGTVPRACPRGGFKAKAEFIFAANGDPATPESETVPVTAPCPKR